MTLTKKLKATWRYIVELEEEQCKRGELEALEEQIY
jgi:hypothetical protein